MARRKMTIKVLVSVDVDLEKMCVNLQEGLPLMHESLEMPAGIQCNDLEIARAIENEVPALGRNFLAVLDAKSSVQTALSMLQGSIVEAFGEEV